MAIKVYKAYLNDHLSYILNYTLVRIYQRWPGPPPGIPPPPIPLLMVLEAVTLAELLPAVNV